jgi:CBS domain-containing protein
MARTVRDIMNSNSPTVGPDADVESVVRLIAERDVSAVIVVNEGGRPIGIITEADLVIADEEGDLHLPHYIELFGGVVFLEPLRRFEKKLKKAIAARAGDLMTADPVTVDAEATAREAAKVIVEKHHNHVPVVEHGRLVGLVTRADVLGALVDE